MSCLIDYCSGKPYASFPKAQVKVRQAGRASRMQKGKEALAVQCNVLFAQE